MSGDDGIFWHPETSLVWNRKASKPRPFASVSRKTRAAQTKKDILETPISQTSDKMMTKMPLDQPLDLGD